MSEGVGILMAMASSAIGGGATAFIRFMVASTDPVTLAALRFGSGFILLLPVALWLRSPWPKGRDWVGVIGLGILLFGLCFTASLKFAAESSYWFREYSAFPKSSQALELSGSRRTDSRSAWIACSYFLSLSAPCPSE